VPGFITLIEPYYSKGYGGRPAYPLTVMLRVHLIRNWFGYSDPAMAEALYETTILNIRRLLKKNMSWRSGFYTVIWAVVGCCGAKALSMQRSSMRRVPSRTQ
jgi:hypothetical protein